MSAQSWDPRVAITAIVCAALVAMTLVGVLGAVAILAGDLAVGAVAAALAIIVTKAATAWRARKAAQNEVP